MSSADSYATMEESEEIVSEKPLLLLENSDDPEAKPLGTDEIQESVGKATGFIPFKRWVDSLRSKRSNPHNQPQRHVDGWSDVSQSSCGSSNLSPYCGIQEQQWESLSGHSSNLGTVKTTTMSITSQSFMRSRGTTQSTTNQSIRSDIRGSVESLRPTLSPSVYEEAQSRGLKRRQVLREILTTESNYVLGLKALTDVLFLFSVRPQIYHNIQQIRELHENFLTRIRNVTPRSVFTGSEIHKSISLSVSKSLSTIDLAGLKGFQNRSLRTRSFKASINSHLNTLTREIYAAFEVAREIGKMSMSFWVYEEFCSNYELLTQDVTLLRQSIPNWETFENGIEALSKSVTSMENREIEGNKSMSLNDLLIKPIQRICKYPLLLQELLKWTILQDDPSSHDGIRQVLESVRVSVAHINSATGNPIKKDLILKTFLLQNKLEFPEPDIVQDVYKQLGPINLCGVLHVTYQSLKHTLGEYMVCVLFNSYLFIARVNDDYRRLQAVASLYISDMKIDTLRNGRGLCCYGCLFSWKLIFQHQDDKFELVLSAASATEERQWKTEILKSSAALADKERPAPSEQRMYSFLSLALVPLDSAPRLAPPLARKSSVHSLATSLVKTNLQHVVIKKTHCPYRSEEAPFNANGEIERPKMSSSWSAMILTTRRQDRVRLERFISDIYTRNALPFPGMVLARGDILFGHGSLIRRLSLRPGLSRRSSSLTLPTTGYPALDANTTKYAGSKTEGPAEKSRHGIKFENHDDKNIPEGSPVTVRRAETVKFKEVPRSASYYDLSSRSKGDSENPSLKSSIRTILNSVSLRRPKRRSRLGLGSGAW